MGLFDGKVAIVTGAGRGIGRGHALLLASEGAKVVVNDLGGTGRGEGADLSPAEEVVAEIEAAGGEAVVNGANVADWNAAEAMVQQAVDTYGRLDVLINNAGILRDRMSFNMSEEEWDVVVDVVLKGCFSPSRHAAAYWRATSKASGAPVNGAIVNTSSGSGLWGNAGQANYGAAKMGIAALTIIQARELEGIGVRVNGIAPTAATRLLGTVRGPGDVTEGERDPLAPGQVSPLVCWLASDNAAGITGQMFNVSGAKIELLAGWHRLTTVDAGDDDWTLDRIQSLRSEIVGGNDTGVPGFSA
jgi:NAD(P)-dependent dehydrogenase (short-subunit alcohol dehydrogenase family)